MGRKDGKPRGRVTAYAFFVQMCREEHKKKHPNEQVVFTEFSRKCAEKWKQMLPKEKKRFEDMAAKDKIRYENESALYVPADGESPRRKRKQKKDPNAPKKAMSAFFFFCKDARPKVMQDNPGWRVGDVAKELGKQWEQMTPAQKAQYEEMTRKDKIRYEAAIAAYRKQAGIPAKKPRAAPAQAAMVVGHGGGAAASAVQQQQQESDEEESGSEEESD